ncbi:PrgI family protein [Nocardiopsis lucentensis]|uniref:PrgI family protein n=1 Tax=Nocardiopsis lucentensis TaxID=53441 RepID=UPI00034BC4B7|nr:PrgI family protein [Nocardiopsis lucentensis]
MDQDVSTWHARIPADIDRPEPVLWNLTARQLLVITPAGLTAWVLFSLLLGHLTVWLLVIVAAVLLALGWVLACGRKDGIGLDHMVWLAARWKIQSKHRHPAPPPVDDSGVIDLDGRCAVLLECDSAPFHLSSGEEQDQMLATFAAFLDSLTSPAQILIQRRRMDLTPHLDRLRTGIPRLPAELRRAARAHAAFLDGLQHHHDLISHRVLLVLTEDGPSDTAGEALLRRAEDAVSQLGALDVRARVCDGDSADQIIHTSLLPHTTATTDEKDHA